MDEILGLVFSFIYYTWFFWVLLILWPLAADTWLAWRQKEYEHSIKWSILEIMIPREVLTSAKAMEQIFLQLHSYKNYPMGFIDKWWKGEVTLWHSFEIVGIDGEVHFYVRTPRQYVDLIEAAFFAYYADIEIIEVEDYLKAFPSSLTKLYAENKKVTGTEIILERSPVYPIRDYTQFESPDENKQYDPMSGFIEMLSKLKPGSLCAIQILTWPAFVGDPHDEHAMHEYAAEMAKAKEPKDLKGHGGGGKIKFHGILPIIDSGGHKDDAVAQKPRATPGELDVLKAVEENMSRPLFSTLIRAVYAAPADVYDENIPRRAVLGAFNQYRAINLNAFKHNSDAGVKGSYFKWPHVYPNVQKSYRAARLWHDFRHREIPPHTYMGKLLSSYLLHTYFGSKSFHMNTRSLATIWHPPTHAVLTGPHIRRIDSKKAGPPAGIDIFGDESEIDKFR